MGVREILCVTFPSSRKLIHKLLSEDLNSLKNVSNVKIVYLCKYKTEQGGLLALYIFHYMFILYSTKSCIEW